MQIWKAHYRDEFHDTDIEILNDYKELSFILDGVKFIGCTINDFELADNNQFSKNKFRLMKYGNGEYYCTLQRYALDVEIPIQVIRKIDTAEITGTINISFQLIEHDKNEHQGIIMFDIIRVYYDDTMVKDFSLCVDGKRYSSEKNTLDFETALSDICRKMKQDYYIKSCFTCQYSEYSPCGNDDFGTMMCYRECKEKCLKVKSKADYFKYLGDENFTSRQETFLCSEYDLRNKCDGYRGFVDI